MEILNIKMLYGPNYWSNYRKNLIVLKVDLKEFEEKPSHRLPGFIENLKKLIPSLEKHHCSYKEEGGFFKRLHEGTWLGHVLEHVALELQWLAGMKCGYGRTRSTRIKGIYHIVFAYEFPKAGIYAAYAAFDIVKTLAHQSTYSDLEKNVNELKNIYFDKRFGPSTEAIVKELKVRNIPYRRLEDAALLLLGEGKEIKYLQATETSQTSLISAEIASDKDLTKKILKQNHIPVPFGMTIETEDELAEALKQISFPIVIKPVNANHGKGVTCYITDKDTAIESFRIAKQYSCRIIVEECIKGFDFRFLVINYQLVAVAKREPAKIIGDGISTIQDLISAVNQEPARGDGHDNILTKIVVDEAVLKKLRDKNLTLFSILAKDEILYLKEVANISSGGTAENVTDIVHPANKFLAERIARLIHLDVCGIDILAQDISKPIDDHHGAIVEVNSAPGFRMHLFPSLGKAINVAKYLVDMIYPGNTNGRIPIIAVTGTNGKTTVVRLLAYILQKQGNSVGYTTTDGIYINDHEIFQGDCSGPESAKTVLSDSSVDLAVLECARGGILRSGLAFDHCNISIVTNVSEDHLGLEDIFSLDEMARVKSVVPRSTFKEGYAILNADDDLVYDMRLELHCKIALFSLLKNSRIDKHLSQNGIATFIDQDQIILAKGDWREKVGSIYQMPITNAATSIAMIKNLLPVVLGAYLSHCDLKLIRDALQSFQSTPALLPGRMNLFKFKSHTILLDYAHNANAFLDLQNYLLAIKAKKKIGIIAATGDRRQTDIIRIGRYCADIFDDIVIRHDKDSRGRTNQQLTEWLIEGILQAQKNNHIKIISDEFEAINNTLSNASADSFIFYFPDKISEAIKYLNNLMNANQSFDEKITT